MMSKKIKWAALLLLLSFTFCGIIFFIDGKYYYKPWGATVNSKGCTSDYGLVSGAVAVVASHKTELEIVGTNMTLTINNYSDTNCVTLANTIIAKSTLATNLYVQTQIIYYDIDKLEYKTWSREPVSAINVNITNVSAELTCKTSSCNLATISKGCATGTLSNGAKYDYAACQFAGQPKPLYTLVYRNNFNELMFGTSHSPGSGPSFSGDTESNRHKYIYANNRYITQ
ncbi:MAG: hypothetical protein OEV78_01750 [Spirochaetia bacterium]|nr:hypothetical protein [Spirochaetia bacterium]